LNIVFVNSVSVVSTNVNNQIDETVQ